MENELDSLFDLGESGILPVTSPFVMRAGQVYHMHGCALVKCDHIRGEIWGDRWECPFCGCYRKVGSQEIVVEGA